MIEEESIQPVTLERDSMVHEAVSRVVSNIMPVGSDTMTTLNDTTPGKLFLKVLNLFKMGTFHQAQIIKYTFNLI